MQFNPPAEEPGFSNDGQEDAALELCKAALQCRPVGDETSPSHWVSIASIDTAFVVMDPADSLVMNAVRKLTVLGLKWVTPGCRSRRSTYARPTPKPIPRGYYYCDLEMVTTLAVTRDTSTAGTSSVVQELPADPIPPRATYTYLVSNRLLVDTKRTTSSDTQMLTGALSIGAPAKRLRRPQGWLEQKLRGMEGVAEKSIAMLGRVRSAIIPIVAFYFTALGVLDRPKIERLSAIVALLSSLQAAKDPLLTGSRANDGSREDIVSDDDPVAAKGDVALSQQGAELERKWSADYLDACADLLGYVSSIAGHLTHLNSALAFYPLTGYAHARALFLKLDVQIKLLQMASPKSSEQ